MSTSIDERLRNVLRDASYDAWPRADTPHAKGLRRDGPELLMLTEEGAKRIPNDQTRGFWRRLSETTGISHKTWNNFFHGTQRSTPAMIETASKLWPQYAFWLVTGITDAANGHVAPEGEFTFPEVAMVPDPWSNEYFRRSIQLLQLLEHIATRYDLPKAGGNARIAACADVASEESYVALRSIRDHRELERSTFYRRVWKGDEADPSELFYKPAKK